MTTTTRNEAAERLRVWISDAALLWPLPKNEQYVALREFDDALAAERRATVERIRAEMPDEWHPWEPDQRDEAHGYNDALHRVLAILDEEAAR